MQETHVLKTTSTMLGISRDMAAVGFLSTEHIYPDCVTPGAEPYGSHIAVKQNQRQSRDLAPSVLRASSSQVGRSSLPILEPLCGAHDASKSPTLIPEIGGGEITEEVGGSVEKIDGWPSSAFHHPRPPK